MNEREKIIRLWFDMWLTQQDLGIDDIFLDNVIYIECWSPKYENCQTVKHWFNEWNTRGKVLAWDIKQFFHKDNQTIVEWHFKNKMNEGKVEEFDDISLIVLTANNKIKALKEFGCNCNNYNPYKDSETPLFRDEKVNWFYGDKSRPKFDKITSFDEFNKYYWYREELSRICKSLGLEHRGTKQDLNYIIEQYFKGNFIKKSSIKNEKKQVKNITLDTPLLECGFSFNTHFREYFSNLTDVSSFKFTADMATVWRKVKRENDLSFTIQDMLKVYYGKSNYAKYDNSICQWNKFLKDFCADENSYNYSNKLKVASILWKEVRNSRNEKIYSKNLLTEYADKIKEYCK